MVARFENRRQDSPIVLGLIATAPTPSLREAEHTKRGDLLTTSIDGAAIELTPTQKIVLRCGKSSTALIAPGKILIRGEYLLGRPSGLKRMTGGSVQIH